MQVRFNKALKILYLAFAALTHSWPAAADRGLWIRGVGNDSCASYARAYETWAPYRNKIDHLSPFGVATAGQFIQYEAWATGYINGLETMDLVGSRLPDRAAVQDWLYQYCKQHPLTSFVNAALSLHKALGGTTTADPNDWQPIIPPR